MLSTPETPPAMPSMCPQLGAVGSTAVTPPPPGGSFLLLEDGSYLLLEDGSKISLE